jgi:hypothetical protein
VGDRAYVLAVEKSNEEWKRDDVVYTKNDRKWQKD